ncbi:MAG TPA: transcriptional regulator [Chloroflexi bacterium]|nr:transcriptional regulator [Chloroflexota bacterium]HBY09057.1 transcriptional regulator [Chloroflexota bacterium]
MPIYEFDCHDCGDQFEALVFSINKVQKVTCPQCQSGNIKKKVSTFAVKGNSGSGSSASSFSSSAASCSTGST